MVETQAADPKPSGNPPAAEQTEKDSSILTGEVKAAEGTTPLAESTTSELPRKWMEALYGDQKEDPEAIKILGNFEKGLPDISKAYVELVRKLGQTVRIPDDKATDEEKARFLLAYRKVNNVPEKPTDYKLEKAKYTGGLFEGMDDRLAELACKLGLTPNQLTGMHALVHKEISETLVKGLKAYRASAQETEAKLRSELGQGYDAAEADWSRSMQYFSAESRQILARSGIGNHPAILKDFAKIGRTISEHKIVDGKPAGVGEKKPLEQLMYPEKPKE